MLKILPCVILFNFDRGYGPHVFFTNDIQKMIGTKNNLLIFIPGYALHEKRFTKTNMHRLIGPQPANSACDPAKNPLVAGGVEGAANYGRICPIIQTGIRGGGGRNPRAQQVRAQGEILRAQQVNPRPRAAIG